MDKDTRDAFMGEVLPILQQHANSHADAIALAGTLSIFIMGLPTKAHPSDVQLACYTVSTGEVQALVGVPEPMQPEAASALMNALMKVEPADKPNVH